LDLPQDSMNTIRNTPPLNIRTAGPAPEAAATAREAPRSLAGSILRALRGRCPNCGRGRLFRSYLKQVERCAVCSEPWAEIRADDGPPWLTILVVGHLVVPVALAIVSDGRLGAGPTLAITVGLALLLCLLVLPRAKGVFIGAIWALRARSD
jgi:uncharacterized protein (DUF983 family)